MDRELELVSSEKVRVRTFAVILRSKLSKVGGTISAKKIPTCLALKVSMGTIAFAFISWINDWLKAIKVLVAAVAKSVWFLITSASTWAIESDWTNPFEDVKVVDDENENEYELDVSAFWRTSWGSWNVDDRTTSEKERAKVSEDIFNEKLVKRGRLASPMNAEAGCALTTVILLKKQSVKENDNKFRNVLFVRVATPSSSFNALRVVWSRFKTNTGPLELVEEELEETAITDELEDEPWKEIPALMIEVAKIDSEKLSVNFSAVKSRI
jgi:hypothetical protein